MRTTENLLALSGFAASVITIAHPSGLAAVTTAALIASLWVVAKARRRKLFHPA